MSRLGLVERIEYAVASYRSGIRRNGSRISDNELDTLLELLSEANQRIIDCQRQLYKNKKGS